MSDEIGMPPAGKASGWYPSPNSAGYGEYWNGSAWTGIVRADTTSQPDVAAPAPVAAPVGAPVPVAAAVARPSSIGPWTWVGITLTSIFLLISVASSGFPGVLVGAGTIALFTAVYVVISGRRSWLRIPSRKAGALLLGASLVVSFLGAGLSPTALHQNVAPLADNAQVGPTATPRSEPSGSPRPTSVPAASRPGASPIPSPSATAKKPLVVTKDIVEVQDVPFAQTTVSDPNLAAGTSQVTTAGVSGKNSVTYRVVMTDGVETSRTVVKTVVTSAPIAEVTSQGTYVAPVAAPDPAPAPATITPGAFCADADVGTTGLGANGRTYVCGSKGADANGHYHWNK